MQSRRRNVHVIRARGPLRAGTAVLAAAAVLALTTGCAETAQGSSARRATVPPPASAAAPTASAAPATVRLQGNGTPNPGTRYELTETPFPFTFTVPRKGDVQGTWMYGNGSQGLALGLRQSPQTGHASTEVVTLQEVFDPALAHPFVGQDRTVPVPRTAEEWEQWLQRTGKARVVGRQELRVDGVRLVRLRVDVSDDLPSVATFPCEADESCLALSPRGPRLIGQVGSWQFASELAVFELEGRSLVAATVGSAKTVDEWLPLFHAVQESVRL